jgi:hypothetical protein
MMANHKGYGGGEGRISDQTPWLNNPGGMEGVRAMRFSVGSGSIKAGGWYCGTCKGGEYAGDWFRDA